MDMGKKLLDLVIEYQEALADRADAEDSEDFATRSPEAIGDDFAAGLRELQQSER